MDVVRRCQFCFGFSLPRVLRSNRVKKFDVKYATCLYVIFFCIYVRFILLFYAIKDLLTYLLTLSTTALVPDSVLFVCFLSVWFIEYYLGLCVIFCIYSSIKCLMNGIFCSLCTS